MAKPRKYNITPEILSRIKKVYDTSTGNGEVMALAESLKIPMQTITYYARKEGYLKISQKKKAWSEEEKSILKANARLSIGRVYVILKKAGYKRGVTCIQAKRMRERHLANLKGQTAYQLAECFGVAPMMILKWINKGYLTAKRRDIKSSAVNNPYYIKNSDIVKFIKESPELIDLRKVDKWWFIDLAFGGKDGLSPLDQG